MARLVSAAISLSQGSSFVKPIASSKSLVVVVALIAACLFIVTPQRAVAQNPLVRELMTSAAQSERHGQYRVAERLYRRILEKQPASRFAHHRLGVLAARNRDFNKAFDHFQTAQKNGPASVELISDYAAALYLNNDLEAAERKLKVALAIDPANKQAKNNLQMVTLMRYRRYKLRERALAEDRAARQAIERAQTASRIRRIAEARQAMELQAAGKVIFQPSVNEPSSPVIVSRYDPSVSQEPTRLEQFQAGLRRLFQPLARQR